MRDLLTFSMHRRQRRPRIGKTVFERTHEQRQRCAELVTDIAEKCRLRPIELGQCLGAIALVLVGAGVGERGAELIRHQVNKGAVLVVEWTLGIEADHQSCRLRVLSRRSDQAVLH